MICYIIRYILAPVTTEGRSNNIGHSAKYRLAENRQVQVEKERERERHGSTTTSGTMYCSVQTLVVINADIYRYNTTIVEELWGCLMSTVCT